MSRLTLDEYEQDQYFEIRQMLEDNDKNLRKHADDITVIETLAYSSEDINYYVNTIFNGDVEAAIENAMQANYICGVTDITAFNVRIKDIFKSFPDAAKMVEQHAFVAALKGDDTHVTNRDEQWTNKDLVVKNGMQQIREDTEEWGTSGLPFTP